MIMLHMSSTQSSKAVTAATTTAAIAALFLGTAACGSSSKKATPKPSVTSASPSATPSATPSPSATPKASPTSAAPTSAPASTVPPSALVTVPPVQVRTQPPVPPQSTGNFGDGVTVKIAKIAAVKSAGSGPGEIAGAPSVAMTITLANGTAQPVSLQSVAVTATYGSAQTPASPSDGSPAAPFTGSVAAHQTATGTYVFTIPVDQRGNVTVSMSYTASQPTVLFHGAV
jgi:hypothetical protein